jgi:uncharacterized protein YgiM (DUF1202 family)
MVKRVIVFWGALNLAVAVSAATMRVQVQTGQVRSTPSFLGGVVATVGYGQSVEVVSSQGAWHQVRTAEGRGGWMHDSSLTAKRVSTQSGGSVRAGASGDEMALAGKGFNRDVEAQFKAAHVDADFAWVDRMATMKASEEEIGRFVKSGDLKQPGGAK